MSVYLIHFDTPLEHARHYIGYAERVKARLKHHKNGTGARILQVCNERGISYDIVRIWEGEGRNFERSLKNCKNAARYCPVCAISYPFRWGGQITDRWMWLAELNGEVLDYGSQSGLITDAIKQSLPYVVLRVHRDGSATNISRSESKKMSKKRRFPCQNAMVVTLQD